MKSWAALLTSLALVTLAVRAQCDPIPKGFVVPPCTISPDGRYGVTVPLLDQEERLGDAKNSVIELKTGKVIAVIKSKFTGWNRQNHGGVLPCRWSNDGSLLLWEVDGKWFSDSLVLLKFENGALRWQTDILRGAQTEMLVRTKQAAPKKYTLAREANAGSGSAYPEGFTIGVAANGPVALPLNIHAALTSNPKQINSFPQLGSELTGFVDSHGNFNVTAFKLRNDAYEQFEETGEHRDVCPRNESAEEESRRKN
jgi:hypothetical protein